MNIWQVAGAFFGAAGVGAGAMASHAVADAHAADMVTLAAIYALMHAVVLLCWSAQGKIATAARASLAGGIALFSGTIALKYLVPLAVPAMLAPVGGTLLMLGWLLVAISAIAQKTRAVSP